MEFEIKSLSHEDIVNLIATGVYGNNAVCVYSVNKKKYEKLFDDNDCFEDKIAKILLAGGMIEVEDMFAEFDDEVYGNYHVKTKYNEEEGSVSYFVTLETMLKGINESMNGKKYAAELFVLELDDADIAYGLLQCAVFGDDIYG